MVTVVETIMADIVAKGGNKQGKSIQIVELCHPGQSLTCEDQVYMLGDIGAMQVVVVRHRTQVRVVYLRDEFEELGVVDGAQQVVFLEQTGGNHRHHHVSANLLLELKYVEVEAVDLLDEVSVLLERFVQHLGREFEVNRSGVDLDRIVRVVLLECLMGLFLQCV